MAKEPVRTIAVEPAGEEHPLWPAFVAHTAESSVGDVNKEHPDDWMPEWKTFIAGANALLRYSGPLPT